jgi:hypothetical protein
MCPRSTHARKRTHSINKVSATPVASDCSHQQRKSAMASKQFRFNVADRIISHGIAQIGNCTSNVFPRAAALRQLKK